MIETPIIFDENTNYDEVFLKTKAMYMDIVATKNGCGCSNKLDSKLCKILKYLTAAQYNKDKLIPDQARYEEAVEAAYLSINCNC